MTSCARNEEEMKIVKDDCTLNTERRILKGSPEWQVGRRYGKSLGTFSQLCFSIAYGGYKLDKSDILISSKVPVRITCY